MRPGDEAREYLVREADYSEEELENDTPSELAEKLFDYEGLIGYGDEAIYMLEKCGFVVLTSEEYQELLRKERS